jgi:hypothetical protein
VKKLLFWISAIGLVGILVSCTSIPENREIPSMEGKLTFAFFYTNG